MSGIIRLHVRADADPSIGCGHVRRTLAVAEEIKRQTCCSVRYLMKQGCDARLVRQSGHEVKFLAEGGAQDIRAEVSPSDGPVILDSYTLTEADLFTLHKRNYCTIVFDDGCRLSKYAADAVLDYAPEAAGLPYTGSHSTRFLLGPRWFPLRGEFHNVVPAACRPRDVPRVLVTFGGSDPDDQTARVLCALASEDVPWRVTALLGPGYRGRAVELLGAASRFAIRRDVENVAIVFNEADVALCGAGGTCFELAFLGVPMVLLALSADQCPIASCMEEVGAAVDLGWFFDVSDREIVAALREIVQSRDRQMAMRAAGRALVDGKGAVRVAAAVSDIWSDRKGSG